MGGVALGQPPVLEVLEQQPDRVEVEGGADQVDDFAQVIALFLEQPLNVEEGLPAGLLDLAE
jgi:hypothetical protein